MLADEDQLAMIHLEEKLAPGRRAVSGGGRAVAGGVGASVHWPTYLGRCEAEILDELMAYWEGYIDRWIAEVDAPATAVNLRVGRLAREWRDNAAGDPAVGAAARNLLHARPAAARVVSRISGSSMIVLGLVLLTEHLTT